MNKIKFFFSTLKNYLRALVITVVMIPKLFKINLSLVKGLDGLFTAFKQN